MADQSLQINRINAPEPATPMEHFLHYTVIYILLIETERVDTFGSVCVPADMLAVLTVSVPGEERPGH